MENFSIDNRRPTIPSLGLRPREAAKALGIGERSLWEMTKSGEIPHVKLGRRLIVYPVDVLRAWLKSRVVKGGTSSATSHATNANSGAESEESEGA